MIEITNENLSEYRKRDFKTPDYVTWNRQGIPFVSAKNIITEGEKGDIPSLLDAAVGLSEEVLVSKYGVKALTKLIKSNPDDVVRRYRLCGGCDITPNGSILTEDMMKDMFAEKFGRRTPQILPQMAAVSDRYGIDPHLIYEKFNVERYKSLQYPGSSLPKAEVIICATFLSSQEIRNISGNPELAQMVSSLLVKGLKKGKDYFKDAAHFIAMHPDSDLSLLEKIYEDPEKFEVKPDSTIDFAKGKEILIQAKKEVEKIEKAYKKPGFKLKNCKCLLKDKEITVGKYYAHILKSTDPRQVMLGIETNCCQKLGDAGETAMMYGLTNEHAGFWVLEDKNSGKLYAQAESWEADEDTLILDNIEFANNADLEYYLKPIGMYLANSPYKNIAMGCGYNELSYKAREALTEAPDFTPTVTPYDIYVMSYEEDMWVDDGKSEDEMCKISSVEKAQEMLESGKATYYDYLYSDVDDDKGVLWLKQNGRVDEYFGKEFQKNTEEKSFSHIDKEETDREVPERFLKFFKAFKEAKERKEDIDQPER